MPEAADNLAELAERSRNCQACPLWKTGTQTVFGEGPPNARVMLVGEQPGDREDVAGKPFVGPAGKVLDAAVAEAGIDRAECYVTNAVKHFKWVPSGTRRLHKRPNTREIKACRPWVDGEIAFVQPEVVVCLGATAAQSLIAPDFKLTDSRGKPFAKSGRVYLATIHPSFVLRQRDREGRHEAMQGLVRDLAAAKTLLYNGSMRA